MLLVSTPAQGDESTTLYDKVCQWFSPSPPISPTNKTDRHDITEILLKVALNTIKPNQLFFFVQNMEFYLLIPENCNNLNILCEK